MTQRSKLSIVREDGVNALDLFREPITRNEFNDAVKALANSYRVNYAGKEWQSFTIQLYAMIVDAGWSQERFARTCEWVVKTLPYANLTISNFFSAPSQLLYPYSWVIAELQKDPTAQSRMEAFEVEGLVLWRYEDGSALPFKRVVLRGKSLRSRNTQPIN